MDLSGGGAWVQPEGDALMLRVNPVLDAAGEFRPEPRPDGQCTGHCRGEANPKAKLKATQVRQIRADYAGGQVSHRTLAARFNVTQGTIWQILQRRIWAHLD